MMYTVSSGSIRSCLIDAVANYPSDTSLYSSISASMVPTSTILSDTPPSATTTVDQRLMVVTGTIVVTSSQSIISSISGPSRAFSSISTSDKPTSISTGDPSLGNSGINTTAIGAGVGGGVAILSFVAFGIYIVRRRARYRQQRDGNLSAGVPPYLYTDGSTTKLEAQDNVPGSADRMYPARGRSTVDQQNYMDVHILDQDGR